MGNLLFVLGLGRRNRNPGILNQLTTALDVASPNSRLVKILTYHVVGKRYDAAGFVQTGSLDSLGSLESLEGSKIKIGVTSTAPRVNGAQVPDSHQTPAPIRGGSAWEPPLIAYQGSSKIATLFLRSQAANVNAWPDKGAQPQTRFASARSERKPP